MNKSFRVDSVLKIKDKPVLTGVVLSEKLSVKDEITFKTENGNVKKSTIFSIDKFRESGLVEVFKGDNVGLGVEGEVTDFYEGQVLFGCNEIELRTYFENGGLEETSQVSENSSQDFEPLVSMNEELRLFISGNIDLVRRGYKKTLDDYNYTKRLGTGYRSILTSKIERGLNIGFSSSIKIKQSIESLELVVRDDKTGNLNLLPYEEFDTQLKKFHLDLTEDEVISILKKLKDKVDLGLITHNEFENRRTELLPYIKKE